MARHPVHAAPAPRASGSRSGHRGRARSFAGDHRGRGRRSRSDGQVPGAPRSRVAGRRHRRVGGPARRALRHPPGVRPTGGRPARKGHPRRGGADCRRGPPGPRRRGHPCAARGGGCRRRPRPPSGSRGPLRGPRDGWPARGAGGRVEAAVDQPTGGILRARTCRRRPRHRRRPAHRRAGASRTGARRLPVRAARPRRSGAVPLRRGRDPHAGGARTGRGASTGPRPGCGKQGPGGRTDDEVRRTLRRVVRQLATLDLVELIDPSTHGFDQAIGDPAQSRARSATLFEDGVRRAASPVGGSRGCGGRRPRRCRSQPPARPRHDHRLRQGSPPTRRR